MALSCKRRCIALSAAVPAATQVVAPGVDPTDPAVNEVADTAPSAAPSDGQTDVGISW